MDNGDMQVKCLYRALCVGWIRNVIELYNANDMRVKYWEKVNSTSEKRVQLITAYLIFFVSAEKDYEKGYQEYIKNLAKRTK